jgi:hypothetical protein
MRIFVPVLIGIALASICSEADAQAQCPELIRLRNAASGVPRGLGTCEGYIRSAMAWDDVRQYADGRRESCAISDDALSNFEKLYRQAVTARNNVCAGRPSRPFPAEIIRD